MLFALAALVDELNELSTYCTTALVKKRRREKKSTGRTTVVYAIKGRVICQAGFPALLNLSEKTLQRHAQDVTNNPSANIYITEHNKHVWISMVFEKSIAHAFLKSYAAGYALECPRGRESRDDSPLRLLPSDTSRMQVHQVYGDQFLSIVDGLSQILPSCTKPNAPMSYSLFTKYWVELMPTLRIASSGSEFCDIYNPKKRNSVLSPNGSSKGQLKGLSRCSP